MVLVFYPLYFLTFSSGQVNLVIQSLHKMNIGMDQKELAKMDKIADKNKKISKLVEFNYPIYQ